MAGEAFLRIISTVGEGDGGKGGIGVQAKIPITVCHVRIKRGKARMNNAPRPMRVFVAPLLRQNLKAADNLQHGGREGQKHAVDARRFHDRTPADHPDDFPRGARRIIYRPRKMVNPCRLVGLLINVPPALEEFDVIFREKPQVDAGPAQNP